MRKAFIVTVEIFFLIFSFPVYFALAQTTNSTAPNIPSNYYSNLTSSVGQGGINLSVSPQYSSPGEAVSFSLQDFQNDLNTATIVWIVNGTKISSGVGDTSLQITAGSANKAEIIKAIITFQNGTIITKNITIIPSTVDLLWQAHSYTPPFYLGKALFPYQGNLTITAMPSFSLSNPSDAIYSWKVDDQVMSGVSGFGKNTITLTGSILLKPINITVIATSLDGKQSAENSISLTGTSPSVIFYQESPLYGLLLNEALGPNITINNQVGLNAIPYFFDTSDPYTPNTSFSWAMNNQTIAGQSGQILNVAPPPSQNGNSTVSVSVTNNTKAFQTGSASIGINFGTGSNG